MRSVAPDSPGRAASQNSWSVVKREADRGQLRDDHRPHHPDREGEQQRRNRDPQVAPGDGSAVVPRTPCPPAASPRCDRGPMRADVLGLVDRLHLREARAACSSACAGGRRAPCCGSRDASRRSATATRRNSSMKQLVQMPVRSLSTPKAIGSTKPPSPPIMPTRPPTAPTWSG